MNKKVVQDFTPKKADFDKRLDIFVSEKLEISRSQAQKLIAAGQILVNEGKVTSKYLVQKGDNITFHLREAKALPDITVIFEDKDIIVIDKPAGITAHPAPGETGITVSEIYASKYKGSNISGRDNIVHRLDKGTSGVMVLAKNEAARASLVNQFASRGVNKLYLALLQGRLVPSEGIIDMPLARDLVSRNKIAPADEGKDAKTLYKVVKYYKKYTLVSANPKTGRTHQIRVHFSAIGHPLVGDVRYGLRDSQFDRMFLHAAELSFIHPSTGKRVKYKSEIPKELSDILYRVAIE